jgi:hypothetical protein
LARASGYWPSELDEAIQEELERAGGYDAWRRKSYTNEVALEPPTPRVLSKSEQYADACKLVAEYRGISVEELFKQPEYYKPYRRLVFEE